MFADDTLTWLTNSPWWAIVTFVVFLVLGIYSIYLTYMSFRDKNVRDALRTNNLIRDVTSTKMPGVTMTFVDYHLPIENLSVTRLALWNAGQGGVKRENVKRPLHIRLAGQDNVILSISIIQYNRPDKLNGFECHLAPDRRTPL